MVNLTNTLNTLREWRESNDRKSREIIDIWVNELAYNFTKLGREKPLVLEQVCIAALDTYQMGVAQKCIEELYKDFPKSLRVKKFEAMYLEAEEKFEDALEILEHIIKTDDTNSAARKRKISVLKAQGKSTEAMKELTDYLKIYMADMEAWQELCELYISENDFSKAAFCLEELLLHNPHNHLLHQRYADIKYTQGGLENIEIAKTYYCQAIKLNPKNLRAFYGLYLATSSIGISGKSSQVKKKEALKMSEWAISEIKEIYSKETQDSALEKRLEALTIN